MNLLHSVLIVFIVINQLLTKSIQTYETNHLPINFVDSNLNDDLMYSNYINSKPTPRLQDIYDIENLEDVNYFLNLNNQSDYAMPKSSSESVKWINLNELIDLIVYLNQQRTNTQSNDSFVNLIVVVS